MATLAEIQSAYERALARFEVAISIDHGGTVYTATGRIFAETGDPLSDAIQQGRLKAIIRAEGLAIVPERGDFLVVDGTSYTIQAVDNATRRVEGVTVAYEVTL